MYKEVLEGLKKRNPGKEELFKHLGGVISASSVPKKFFYPNAKSQEIENLRYAYELAKKGGFKSDIEVARERLFKVLQN